MEIEGSTWYLYFENRKDKGEVEVTKIVKDEDGNVIEDDGVFTFRLHKLVDDKWIKQYDQTIIGNGKVSFTELEDGKYSIRENDPPTGYTLISKKIIYFDIGEENKYAVEFVNEKDAPPPLKEIEVQKIVEGLEDLSGFTFRLYRLTEAGEEFVDVLTTDASGLLNFGEQPDGEYVLYEDSKPGFIMGIGEVGSEGGYPFYHPEQTEEPIGIVNRRVPEVPNEGEIDVTKVVRDENGATIFDNSIFTFILEKYVDGVWQHEATKSIVGNGNAKFTELADGEYRVREINTPGYTLMSSNNLLVSLYEENTGSVVFTNRRDRTPPPQDDPDDDPDDDTPTPRPTPTLDPESEPEPDPELPEEEEEVDQETPQGQPEVEPEVKDETIELPEEEEEVAEPVPEAKPVATLPKTGTASPLMASGFGTLLLATGLFLRKKKG